MFVRGASIFLRKPDDSLKNLEAGVKAQTGVRFRRVNRFILLALAGAHQCAAGGSVSPEAGVFLTTENGTVGDTEKVLGQLFRDRSYPMPYNFINTMSNTASFYISQSLNLTGRNFTLSSKDFSFERGLELLRTDLRTGVLKDALIGGVDEAVFSETRLQSRFGDRLTDGSAWLHVTGDRAGAIGEIVDIRSFPSMDAAMEWTADSGLSDQTVVSFSALIEPEERNAWTEAGKFNSVFDYVGEYGYFDSAVACGVCAFFQRFNGAGLLSVNKDIFGHCALLYARVY